MGVTMRVIRGRKAKNPKYTIRKSISVHANKSSIRVTKSIYKGSSENDPKNRASSNSRATINVDTNSGIRRRYVSIG